MTSYVTPKKNTAFIMYAALPSVAAPNTFKANPTLAAGDFLVSIDGGALANLATLPTVTPASGKMVKFSLSSTEMNGDNITIVCSDAAGNEWGDVIFNIQTSARQIDDLAYPATSGRSIVVDAAGLVDANTVKIGPTGSGTAQTAKDVGGAVPAAAAGASGGLLISGSNSGTTTLGALTVTGATTLTGNVSAAAGITITQSTSNGHGITVTGNGTGSGIRAVGGATGAGITALGGATSGDGINAAGQTSGHGLTVTGVGTTKHGLNATGGATTSAGISATGGATSGDALLLTAPTLGHGMSINGAGASKHGMNIISGTSSGNGMYVQGGSTSGDGIKVTTTSGHGLNLAPVGASMHGILSTGGNSGTSDGIKAAAGTGGVDIRGNITGNLVGTVSTLTTYTGNTPQTGDAYARLGAPAGASVSVDIAAVKTDTAAVKAKTDNLPVDPADASDIAASFTTVNTKLDTIDDFIDTEVAAIKAKTDNLPAAPAAVSDIPTANANADALLDRANGIETGITLRQSIRLALAALAGKLSGAATTTIAIRDANDTKTRITATVDADGNRSAVTLDAS